MIYNESTHKIIYPSSRRIHYAVGDQQENRSQNELDK